jgi:hypothetical protein
MSAGKNNSRVRSRKRTAFIAMFAMLAIAGRSHHAYAACGLPSTMELSGAGQAEAGTASSQHGALRVMPSGNHEPIVGLWSITEKDSTGALFDRVISGFTGDGLEFDQDLSPILTGYVCYGTWVKVGRNTYGLTHPFYTFQDPNSNGEGTESTEGQWDGNSGYFDYTLTVSKDGQSFTGKEILKVVQGPDPYDPKATVLFSVNLTLSATKFAVDTSLLP